MNNLYSNILSYSDYFLLYSISQSISAQWKPVLRDPSYNNPADKIIEYKKGMTYFEVGDQMFILENLKAKQIYKIFINKDVIEPTSKLKYQQKYPEYTFEWEEIYSIPYKATIDTKHREFQWKILHRILYGNSSLYKMQLVDSPLCIFCKTENETLEHLFFRCKLISNFWMAIENSLKTEQILLSRLLEIEVLVGITKEIKYKNLINFLIIIAKRFIYFCRYKKNNACKQFRFILEKSKTYRIY